MYFNRLNHAVKEHSRLCRGVLNVFYKILNSVKSHISLKQQLRYYHRRYIYRTSLMTIIFVWPKNLPFHFSVNLLTERLCLCFISELIYHLQTNSYVFAGGSSQLAVSAEFSTLFKTCFCLGKNLTYKLTCLIIACAILTFSWISWKFLQRLSVFGLFWGPWTILDEGQA